jgi:copper(I)-binding protein
MPPHRRSRLATALLVAALPLAACGEEAPADPGADELAGGGGAPDEAVGTEVEVIGVQLEYPLDGRYEEGADASLYFALANTGTAPVTLVDITGPDFQDAASTGGSTGGGDALEIEVPPNDNVYVGAEGMPAVTLLDLGTDLRSSESIPVTFVFEDAGEVTVEAVVAAEGQDPVPTYDFPDPDEDANPGG